MAAVEDFHQSLIPSLPISLIARIVTYNVTSLKDVAQLRLVGKAVGQHAIHLFPLECSHWIRCPERRLGTDAKGSFVERICALDWIFYDYFGIAVGDSIEESSNKVSLIDSPDIIPSKVTVRVVGQPKNFQSILDADLKNYAITDDNETEYLEKLASLCKSMVNASTKEQFLSDNSDEMLFFDPPQGSSTASIVDYLAREEDARMTGMLYDRPYYFAVPAMVTFAIDPTANYIHRTLAFVNNNDTRTFYQVNVVRTAENDPETNHWNLPLFQPLFPGGKVWAVDAGPVENGPLRLAHMLMYLQTEYADIRAQEQLRLFGWSSLWDEHQQHQLVEGVVVVDDFMSFEFRQSLIAQVDALAEQQERDHAVDYHPHSNQVVRDLVHPALYSYVQNVTPLIANVQDVEPCLFPGVELTQEPSKDFWGRSYETSPYQWLPSYVSISTDGKCKFDTYINNLTPRDDPVCSVLYKSLENLLEHALPFIESGLSYVHAVRPILRYERGYEDVDFNGDPLNPMNVKPLSLRGHKLQVIAKVVDYELTPHNDTYEGVWHVEGMSHEEIVLTCLYILDRDESIEGGGIEFKRAILRDEAGYLKQKIPQNPPWRLHMLVDQDGLVPLGTVGTPCGRLVVFPNSHVHRVKEMKLVRRSNLEGDEKRTAVIAKRRIVVFFVVNPLKRIVSTREVAPQQIHSGGKLPHEEALQHRLALMAERKYKKQDWNVREIELCEH
jgi:hypothetical protein